MEDSKFLIYKIEINAPLNYSYCKEIKNNIFPGWRIVDNSFLSRLPDFFKKNFKNNQLISLNKIISEQDIINKLNNISESQLVNLLEKKGIGRPSTFSSLIDKIKKRGFVNLNDIKGHQKEIDVLILHNNFINNNSKKKVFGKQKNKLSITDKGLKVIDFYLNIFPLFLILIILKIWKLI